MIWRPDYAASGAAALVVAAGAFALIQETSLASLCWLFAAGLTAVYMYSDRTDT